LLSSFAVSAPGTEGKGKRQVPSSPSSSQAVRRKKIDEIDGDGKVEGEDEVSLLFLELAPSLLST
jgi:hypothetical protein